MNPISQREATAEKVPDTCPSTSERDKLINDYSDVWTYELIAWYTYPYVD